MKDVNILTSNGVNVQKSLELFGDMNTYNETLETFLKEVTQKIENIKKYKEVADMANYSILVHSLKSDSKYFGFEKLAELSLKHEMESKENNIYAVYDGYDELMNEANRIVGIVRQYLGDTETVIVSEEKVASVRDKNILVVDDSDLIRNFIGNIFSSTYGVLIANDGREAIKYLEENKDDKIVAMLLDLNMPNVNGYAVLDYFNANGLFSKIPVAIITGDGSTEAIQKAFNYKIVDILRKPFNERDVKTIVDKLVGFHE